MVQDFWSMERSGGSQVTVMLEPVWASPHWPWTKHMLIGEKKKTQLLSIRCGEIPLKGGFVILCLPTVKVGQLMAIRFSDWQLLAFWSLIDIWHDVAASRWETGSGGIDVKIQPQLCHKLYHPVFRGHWQDFKRASWAETDRKDAQLHLNSPPLLPLRTSNGFGALFSRIEATSPRSSQTFEATFSRPAKAVSLWDSHSQLLHLPPLHLPPGGEFVNHPQQKVLQTKMFSCWTKMFSCRTKKFSSRTKKFSCRTKKNSCRPPDASSWTAALAWTSSPIPASYIQEFWEC